jgi:hypothetical protein
MNSEDLGFMNSIARMAMIRDQTPAYDFHRITPQGVVTNEPFRKLADENSSMADLTREKDRLEDQLAWWGEYQDHPTQPQYRREGEIEDVMEIIHNALYQVSSHIANRRSMTRGTAPRTTLDNMGFGRGIRMKGGRIRIRGNFYKKV